MQIRNGSNPETRLALQSESAAAPVPSAVGLRPAETPLPGSGGGSERRSTPRRAADWALQRVASSLIACLEQMSDGLIVLDLDLRVVHINGSACRIVDQSDGCLSIESGRLNVSCRESDGRLRRVAESAAWAGTGPGTAGAEEILLVKRGDLDPLVGAVFRLPARDDPSATNLWLLLRDPTRRSAMRWKFFARQYQLTRAELRLCLELEAGRTLGEYAANCHISTHTARSQLKSVFAKTGTHRQARLIRLIGVLVRR